MKIEELRRYVDDFTEGEWESAMGSIYIGVNSAMPIAVCHGVPRVPNANAIAALRNAAPQLLAVVEAARACDDPESTVWCSGVSVGVSFDCMMKLRAALDALEGGDGHG